MSYVSQYSKIKCFTLVFLFSIICFSTQAQTTISSLKKQLSVAQADTTTYHLYYDLGTAYRAINNDSAVYYLQQSLRIAERTNDAVRTAQSMYRISYVYYYDKFDETTALVWLKKCLAIASKSKDHLHLARAYIVMGIIADHQNLASENLLLKALFHAKIAKEWITLASCYNVLGDIYRKKQKWKAAEDMLLKMMVVSKNNSSTYWLLACMDYCTILEQQGKYNKAQAYYQQAALVQQKINKNEKSIEGLLQLARLENKLKHYRMSEQYLLECLDLEKAKARPDSERINQIYENLSNAYVGQKKYQQAYEAKNKHLELRLAIKEKAHHESTELQMTRLQATLENEKKEAEITLLAEQKKQQQLLLVAAAVIALLLIGFVVVQQRNRRRIEAQKAELTQLNTTKDRLFAILSHDLRAPVKSLWSYLMLIDWGALSQVEFTESVQSLSGQLSHVNDMLDNVLHWSMSQMGGMRPQQEKITVLPIIEEQIQLLTPVAKVKNLAIINTIPQEAQLWADKNQLAIIVRNLLHNAIKFTHEGGTISLGYLEKENRAYIQVKDTGIGMSEERLEKLFQLDKNTSRTGTAREQGTGLGLILVKELVEANNGSIALSSEEGKGTAFTVSFKR